MITLEPEPILQAGMICLLCGCIASFLTLLVNRDAAGEDWQLSRSRCDSCEAQVGLIASVPMIGYLVQLGRCSSCRQRMSPRYPAIAAAAASMGLLTWVQFRGVELALVLVLSWLLLWLALADLATGLLPRAVSLTICGLGLIRAAMFGSPLMSVLGGLLAGGLCLLVQRLFARVRRIDGLGTGDVILAAAGGAWIGPALVGLMLSGAAAAAPVYCALSGRLVQRERRLPFAPFIAMAIMTIVLVAAGSSEV